MKEVRAKEDDNTYSQRLETEFYVGASRVGAQKNLKIFAPENKTVNIVYQEVLGDL